MFKNKLLITKVTSLAMFTTFRENWYKKISKRWLGDDIKGVWFKNFLKLIDQSSKCDAD